MQVAMGKTGILSYSQGGAAVPSDPARSAAALCGSPRPAGKLREAHE
jgi:hypothetical protein